jgi:hypothetical protein
MSLAASSVFGVGYAIRQLTSGEPVNNIVAGRDGPRCTYCAAVAAMLCERPILEWNRGQYDVSYCDRCDVGKFDARPDALPLTHDSSILRDGRQASIRVYDGMAGPDDAM